MTNFTLPHSLTAAIGAILVSATFVAAAVGPGQTATAQIQTSAQAHA